MKIHKSHTLGGFSIDFLKNAALFSAKEEVYQLGNFVKVTLPFIKIYLVNDPAILKHVLIDNEPKYEKSKIYWLELRRVIGKAMGSVEGAEWTTLKHLQKAYFTKPQSQKYLEDVNSICINRVMAIPTNKEINLLAALSSINLQIVLKTVFGVNISAEATYPLVDIIEKGEAFIAWRSKFPWRPFLSLFTPTWFRTQQNLKYLSNWANDIIETKKYDPASLTQGLLSNGYSSLHIRNEMIVHLGASTETVAVAESWLLYLLSLHPNYYHQVIDEINLNYNDGQFDAIQFPFLTACIKEAMRLYPPSHAIVRDCVSANGDTIDGVKINKGDVMYISAYGIHRNPSLWKNPDSFIPERFLNNNEASTDTYAYLPFGAGKHACIGKYLAMPMVVITMVHILKTYDFNFTDAETKIPISLSTLKSHNGFNVKLSLKK